MKALLARIIFSLLPLSACAQVSVNVSDQITHVRATTTIPVSFHYAIQNDTQDAKEYFGFAKMEVDGHKFGKTIRFRLPSGASKGDTLNGFVRFNPDKVGIFPVSSCIKISRHGKVEEETKYTTLVVNE